MHCTTKSTIKSQNARVDKVGAKHGGWNTELNIKSKKYGEIYNLCDVFGNGESFESIYCIFNFPSFLLCDTKRMKTFPKDMSNKKYVVPKSSTGALLFAEQVKLNE